MAAAAGVRKIYRVFMHLDHKKGRGRCRGGRMAVLFKAKVPTTPTKNTYY